LHSHEHYMDIHYYVWLYLENEEEVEVEEAKTSPPPPEEHQAGNYFYFDICGTEPDSPVTQGKPRCICHFLVLFKIFFTCLMH
jgi:beta-galactosidase beta subunit